VGQQMKQCSNSSLLECPPAVQDVVDSNPGGDLSVSGALVEDGEKPG
jgi:hypothetical protein